MQILSRYLGVKMKLLFIVLITITIAIPSWASNYGFNNLSEDDVDNIFEEFSATFTHSTVSGAKSKSKIFGFEAGLVAGVTKSDHVKEIVARSMPSGSDEIEFLPFASLYALVSLPFGITAEANYIPEVDIQDVEFNHLSLAGKIELTYFMELPVDIAIRGMLIDTNLSITQSSQSSGSFTGTLDYKQTQLGLQAIVGKSFGIIEPYASIGFLSSNGELIATGSGSGSVFNYTASSRVDSEASGLQIVAGLQVNLLLLKVGAEYVNAFGANHLNAKVALSF